MARSKAFAEDAALLDEDEVPDQTGFDLRNKSLVNTQRREVEPKKAVLPLKSIMQGILEKPLSEQASKVG